MKISKFFDLLPTSKYFLENLNLTKQNKILSNFELNLRKFLTNEWKVTDVKLQIGNKQELNLRSNHVKFQFNFEFNF